MKVAVVGASRDRRKFGNKAVRSFLNHGDEVFPIHPIQTEIEGLKVLKSVAEVPGYIDKILLYVSGSVGAKIVSELDPKNVGEVIVNPGAEHPDIDSAGKEKGILIRHVCAVVDIGDDPHHYSDL